ncbi:hypothetical protein BH23VER1_BH23VER1_27120 [soil metagenome]
MQNYEQLRAQSALAYAHSNVPKGGKEGGEVVKKIPAMIIGNGLLAAAAFAFENAQERNQENRGWAACFDHIARHLSSQEIGILKEADNVARLIEELTESDSQTLKLATAEAMEWLGYARRFVVRERPGGRTR